MEATLEQIKNEVQTLKNGQASLITSAKKQLDQTTSLRETVEKLKNQGGATPAELGELLSSLQAMEADAPAAAKELDADDSLDAAGGGATTGTAGTGGNTTGTTGSAGDNGGPNPPTGNGPSGGGPDAPSNL